MKLKRTSAFLLSRLVLIALACVVWIALRAAEENLAVSLKTL